MFLIFSEIQLNLIKQAILKFESNISPLFVQCGDNSIKIVCVGQNKLEEIESIFLDEIAFYLNEISSIIWSYRANMLEIIQVQQIDNEINKSLFTCSICLALFPSKNSLRAHYVKTCEAIHKRNIESNKRR